MDKKARMTAVVMDMEKTMTATALFAPRTISYKSDKRN